MKNLFIDILSFAALISSVLTITSKNPVIAVVFLIAVFINVAGYLILIGVGFIAISYIIVYVGAIVVLFLFVIMMLNIRISDLIDAGNQYTKTVPLAIFVGILFIYEMSTIIPYTLNSLTPSTLFNNLMFHLNSIILVLDSNVINFVHLTVTPACYVDSIFVNFNQVQVLGQGLYTIYSSLLLVLSMILLLAMVAAIFIGISITPPQMFFRTKTKA